MRMKAYNIRIEYGRTDAEQICIIESKNPMISWSVAASRGERQTACRIMVHDTTENVWDSGWQKTSEQFMRYDGAELIPGEVYELAVYLKDGEGREGIPAKQQFCPGSLNEWQAEWLCQEEEKKDAVVTFVKDFAVKGEIEAACLFVCGLGYHKVYINGESVFTEPMNPAYSEYEKRSYYTVLPGLEGVLKSGSNRIGVNVAPGWRTPDNICYELVQRIAQYTGKTQMSAALRIRYVGGEVEWLYTDTSWKYFYGATVSSNLFLGERFDASRLIKDWCLPDTDLPDLNQAALTEAPGGRLQPQTLAPIREQEVYAAKSISQVADGVCGVDFGQNIAGVCRIRIPRDIPAGQVIELHHMEFLDEDGRLYLPQLRNAASVDTYVAAGDGKDPEYWQPEYTYHGFRYAEVTGYPQPLLKSDIEAVSVYTDIAKGSMFSCGNSLINQINRNALQTEKANLHSVLTDCPQRDERMGWMNDATVRFEAAPYSFDIGRLFPKVVRDCMDVQDGEGSITCTAPFAFGARPADPVCSAYLIAGWESWLHTGNEEIITEAYDAFAAWNQFLLSRSEDYIVNYSYYGDWAAPAYACMSEEYAVSAVTPGELMSTGYFYYNACLLSGMAKLIGREADAVVQEEMAQKIRAAFLNKWWDSTTGKVGTGSQGCQSFALWLDILPVQDRQKAADYLHKDLVEKEYCFTTGNLCTRYMLEMLSRYGYVEDAWKVAVREEYPSIGFMIQNEATTIWERFELKKNPIMNSHNHPMYGAITHWFYAYLAGIRPTAAGWKEFEVTPYLPKELLSANAVCETPYGDVVVRWTKRYGETQLYVTVPHGTKATVNLPWGEKAVVENGFYYWSKAAEA